MRACSDAIRFVNVFVPEEQGGNETTRDVSLIKLLVVAIRNICFGAYPI